MVAIVFDTETTGIINPEVIESSWMGALFVQSDVPSQPAALQFSRPVTSRFKPSKAISMGAMATHHIMDEDLEGLPPSTSFRLPDGIQYLIGHNVDFDWIVAGSHPGLRRICTLCLSRKLWPECDSHSLSALTYYLFRDTARNALKSAHSAEADIVITGHLINAILQKCNLNISNFEALWNMSEAARIPEIMPFGKHKGERISDVPSDYKRWLMGQADVDPYLLKALRG